MKPSYRVVFSESVRNAIRKFPPLPKKTLRKALKQLETDPLLREPLEREFIGLYKLTVKNYRIIYKIAKEKQEIQVVAIGPRKTIYLDLLELLKLSEG